MRFLEPSVHARGGRYCILVALVVFSPGARGSEHQGLSFDQAKELLLARSPGLKALHKRVAGEREAARYLGRGKDPALYVQAGNPLNQLELTVGVQAVLGNAQRKARGAHGEALVRERSTEYAVEREAALAAMARRYVHARADQRRVTLAHEHLALATKMVATVERVVQSGALRATDLHRSRIHQARRQIDLEHAEHELASSTLGLTSLWGDDPAGYNLLPLEQTPAVDHAVLSGLHAADVQNPRIVLLEAARATSAADADRAKTRARTPATVTGGVRYLEEFQRPDLVAGINWTPAIKRQGAGEYQRLRYEGQARSHEIEAARLHQRGIVFSAIQEYLHAREAIAVLDKVIVPEARQLLTRSEQGYRAGRDSSVGVIDAQKTLHELSFERTRLLEESWERLITIYWESGWPIGELFSERSQEEQP